MNYLASDATQNQQQAKQRFRVTFACRIPEALRSGNTGCGAVVGIMHYSRMSQASKDPSHRNSCCDVLAAVDDEMMLMDASSFHSDASTPVLVSRVALTTPEVATKTPLDHDDINHQENLFEANRRQFLSQESSWVLMASPSRSSGLGTPASVRRNTSCGTDMCTMEDAASSDDEEHVERGSNPISPPEHAPVGSSATMAEWDELLLLHRSPPSAASARIAVGVMGPCGKLLKPIQR